MFHFFSPLNFYKLRRPNNFAGRTASYEIRLFHMDIRRIAWYYLDRSSNVDIVPYIRFRLIDPI